MDFERKHAAFIRYHLERRTGERRGRLERGHSHGEMLLLKNIWFPLRGNFDCLHPEYEVLDWRGRSYFSDFAWLPGHAKLLLETKGFGPHVRDMDRSGYCNELNRELYLQSLGYRVLSFAYDDVANRPELCMQLLRLNLARYDRERSYTVMPNPVEKAIVRLAFISAQPVRPIDVVNRLNLNHRTAVLTLQRLCAGGWFHPHRSATGKTVKYELVKQAIDMIDFW